MVSPLIFSITTNTNYTSSDYNGFRPNPGVEKQFRFFAPPKGQKIYEPKPDMWKAFPNLKALAAGTGIEQHGVDPPQLQIFERMDVVVVRQRLDAPFPLRVEQDLAEVEEGFESNDRLLRIF